VQLSKWYCDCVAEDGDLFIGYHARLRFGIVTVPHASSIVRIAGETPRQRTTFRRSPAPAPGDGSIRWCCPQLGVHSDWRDLAPPIERRLLEARGVRIDWRCVAPLGSARIDLTGGRTIRGLGYAEQLLLTLKHWRLPFDELLWGRFLSSEDVLVWIRWLGQAARQCVYHNGLENDGATVTAQGVQLPSSRGALVLGEEVVLRDGSLADAVFPGIRGAHLLFPRPLRRVHETKWLARGNFETAERASTGWTIHEVARWS
jgi:hypothetical protein